MAQIVSEALIVAGFMLIILGFYVFPIQSLYCTYNPPLCRAYIANWYLILLGVVLIIVGAALVALKIGKKKNRHSS